MAHAQKPDFIFRQNGRVHLNRQGRQLRRLLAVEVCASAVVMLDTPCSEVVCRVLATHSIHQFPLHFPSRASPCAITFQLDSNCRCCLLEHNPAFSQLSVLCVDMILTVGSAYYCKEHLSIVFEMEKPSTRYEVLTVVLLKMQVSRNMSPWIFLRLGRLGGTLLCVTDVLD